MRGYEDTRIRIRIFVSSHLRIFVFSFFLVACGDKQPSEPIVPVDSTMTEARALWVTRFDWSTASDISQLIDSAAAANFNIIYFQVRGNMDAYYTPGIEPWAQRYNGVSPGWDPLQVALTRAREKGLQLHPWLNSFYALPNANAYPETTPRHALLQHPDWFMVDAAGRPIFESGTTNRWLSPAKAGARSRLAAVAADIARRYDIDGIHLDFIRYPGTTPADSASQAAATAAGMSLDDYRRSAVTSAVREVNDSLKRAKPSSKLSAAVWGIYKPPAGWNTSSGYAQMLQDPRAWAAQGIIDAVSPMVYWRIASTYGARTDFAWLADDHARNISGTHVYIGITLEHMIANGNVTTELPAEIERARQAGAEGVTILSARLLREQKAWSLLRNGVFRRKARLP